MINTKEIYKALELVMDPEIPVLNVLDLGMITSVVVGEEENIEVKMIPTFAACPAVGLIQGNIKSTLEKELNRPVTVKLDKETNWNSNRLTEEAKEKLRNFGLAAPQRHNGEGYMEIMLQTPCPHCNSTNTYLRSPFGSTLCRAMHYCKDCGNMFEQFKPVE